jgi:hypothetical protein
MLYSDYGVWRIQHEMFNVVRALGQCGSARAYEHGSSCLDHLWPSAYTNPIPVPFPTGIRILVQKSAAANNALAKCENVPPRLLTRYLLQSSASTSSSSVPSLSMKPRRRLALTSVAPPRSMPGPPMRFLCATSLSCAARASNSTAFFGGRPRPRGADAGIWGVELLNSTRSESTVIRGVTCRPWASVR